MYKAIMVGYADSNTRYTYKFYNPDTNSVIITRYFKLEEWDITDPS